MAGIFINYRREDSAGWAGRLSRDLRASLGEDDVFEDIAAIEPGIDFAEAIAQKLVHVDVLLAVIGPRWLVAADTKTAKRRLDDPDDLVRQEIATALRRRIRVVPVLVGGATLPSVEELPEDLRELVRRNACELSDTRWDYDVQQLARRLRPPRAAHFGVSLVDAAKSSLKRARIRYAAASVGIVSPIVLFVIAVLNVSGRPCGWAEMFGLKTQCAPLDQKQSALDPPYTSYSSPELGVTIGYPHELLTLDNTKREQRELFLMDGNRTVIVTISRKALDEKNVKKARENELDQLKLNWSVTYIAPEKEGNWKNWYVLSGVGNETEFYYRRWYCLDSIVSIEFKYAKVLAPKFDSVIPKMTDELRIPDCGR